MDSKNQVIKMEELTVRSDIFEMNEEKVNLNDSFLSSTKNEVVLDSGLGESNLDNKSNEEESEVEDLQVKTNNNKESNLDVGNFDLRNFLMANFAEMKLNNNRLEQKIELENNKLKDEMKLENNKLKNELKNEMNGLEQKIELENNKLKEELKNEMKTENNKLKEELKINNEQNNKNFAELRSDNNELKLKFEETNNKFEEFSKNLNERVSKLEIECSQKSEECKQVINKNKEEFKRSQLNLEVRLSGEVSKVKKLNDDKTSKIINKVTNIEKQVIKDFEEISQVKERVNVCESNVSKIVVDVKGVIDENFKNFKEEVETKLGSQKVMVGSEMQLEIVPEFFNEHREPHPKIFIEHLKMSLEIRKLRWEYTVANMKRYFKGESEIWFEAHSREWKDFEGFRKSFLKRFWSEEKQEELRGKIMNGRRFVGNYYDINNYVIRTYNKSQFLDPPMLMNIFIRNIARQLPEDLRLVLLAARPTNLDTLESIIMGWQEDQKVVNGFNRRESINDRGWGYSRHDRNNGRNGEIQRPGISREQNNNRNGQFNNYRFNQRNDHYRDSGGVNERVRREESNQQNRGNETGQH